MASLNKSDMLSQEEIEALRKDKEEMTSILSKLVKERIKKEKEEKAQ